MNTDTSTGIKELIKGYKKFRAHYLDQDSTLFDELVRSGQKPETLVIACSDSRVDPAIIMTAKPGDLFVVRNVANLVPPQENSLDSYHGTSAALQFAVTGLNVRNIIIIGHSQCGGIQSLMDRKGNPINTQSPSFIDKWMELAKASYKMVERYHSTAPQDEQAVLCGKYSLINSLKNLHTFSWIQEKTTNNTLTVHAWYFNLAESTMDTYNAQTKLWKPL